MSHHNNINKFANFHQQQYLNYSKVNVKIYKADNINAMIDNHFGESSNCMYLPYFTLPSFFIINRYDYVLDRMGLHQQDTQGPTYVFNFEQMVKTIDAIKNIHLSELTLTKLIDTSPCNDLYIEKNFNIMKIYNKNEDIYLYLDLFAPEINTIEKLKNFLNTTGVISCDSSSSTDGNIKSIEIVNFEPTIIEDSVIIYSRYKGFDNTANIIEIGDMIMSPEGKLFGVTNAVEDDNIGFEYLSYVVNASRVNMAGIYLPNNGIDFIIDIKKNNRVYNPERGRL